jgi:hypothetical protein
MGRLPSGTVTFLFTDIEGSTQLWENHPEAMRDALAKHDSILREAIESNHGQVIKMTGDGVHSVFEKAIDAVNATLVAQRNFNTPICDLQIKSAWGCSGSGTAAVIIMAGAQPRRRIMSVGHGGQIHFQRSRRNWLGHFPQIYRCLIWGNIASRT